MESILRETCERVLEDSTITREKSELRAVALQMLGEAYMNVKKDDAAEKSDDNDYVKVETKQSRARDGADVNQDGRGGGR